MPLKPVKVAVLGVQFDLTEQFNRLWLEAWLARIGVGNDGFNVNGDDEAIGSDQTCTQNFFAR